MYYYNTDMDVDMDIDMGMDMGMNMDIGMDICHDPVLRLKQSKGLNIDMGKHMYTYMDIRMNTLMFMLAFSPKYFTRSLVPRTNCNTANLD